MLFRPSSHRVDMVGSRAKLLGDRRVRFEIWLRRSVTEDHGHANHAKHESNGIEPRTNHLRPFASSPISTSRRMASDRVTP